MLTPRVLATLVSIDAMGSFLKAAERENMTLSAVSMQMKSLEAALGAALFNRTTRPPRLTPLGRQIVTHARAILDEQNRIIAACQAPGEIKGRVQIGFVPTASVRLLPAFLAQVKETFPHAEFAISTGLSDRLVADVAANALDAAVVTAGSNDDGLDELTVTTLTKEPLSLCMPADWADRDFAACLAAIPFIHFTPDTGIGRLIADYLRSAELEPRNVVVLDTVEAVAECVRSGVGCAILPRPDVERFGDPNIVLRDLDVIGTTPPLARRLVLVTRQGTALDAGRSELGQLLTPNDRNKSK
ncbi:MAG: LysR family transcriptional regulator [Pseudomonadota bacterium]